MKNKLVFDYSKLKGKMKEKEYTQEDGANDLGIATSTFNLKLNNKSYFDQDEIVVLAKKLDIIKENIASYFFTLKV